MIAMIMKKKKNEEEEENPKFLALNDIQDVLEKIAMDEEKGIFEGLKSKKMKENMKPSSPLEIMKEGEPEEHIVELEKNEGDGHEKEEEDELEDENGKPIGYQVIKKKILVGKR